MINSYIRLNFLNILRFAITGLTTYFTLLAIYKSIMFFNINYKIALTFAYWINVLIHFSLNKYFTFLNKSSTRLHFQIFKYIILLIINYLLNLFFISIFIDFFYLADYIAIFISACIISLFTFLFMNHYVFKK